MSVISKKKNELKQAFAACRSGFGAVGLFSFIINALVLAGPMYMMLVYDRALGSGSVPTLVGLSVLLAGLFLVMGLLTIVRSRLLVRIGNRFAGKLQDRVFEIELAATAGKGGGLGKDATRDLNVLRDFLGGPTPGVLFDAPWTPVFVLFAYILHPILGYVAAGGAVLLLVLGLINDFLTRGRLADASALQSKAQSVLSDTLRNGDVVSGMRMGAGLLQRWRVLQDGAHGYQSQSADTAGTFSALTRTFRMMLQSAVLGTGAYLAIGGQLSPGAIIAASVIVARGLAPAEQAVAGWRQFVGASASYARLKKAFAAQPSSANTLALPEPAGKLSVKGLYVAAPGQKKPLICDISFSLEPGEVLGVIGPSGSGKSTLARALVGAWTPLRGDVRLDGAELSQWPDEQISQHLGYLPQDVELFEGTIPENIGRLAAEVDGKEVLRAARDVGAHEMILRLPRGYQTKLGPGGERLSGGERQRIGLARAVYGQPAFVVLDEPNASLDAAGDQALHDTIAGLKRAGRTVVIIAHRPNAIRLADKILVLKEGRVSSYGPKAEIVGDETESADGGVLIRMPRRG